MKTCRTFLFCCVIGLLATRPVLGQAAPAFSDAPPTVFKQLFPNPTRENGYEEWVQASDLIRGNADVDKALDATATLTFKRQLLAQPDVARALSLLRLGMGKPIHSPRAKIDMETTFPELAGFRKLARLLSVEMYVAFADGRTAAAVDSLKVGLSLGYRAQTDTILSGLVGIAVNGIVLRTFAQHLDQLPAKQCDQVYRLAEEFMQVESPAPRLLTLERDQALQMLEQCRSRPGALLELVKRFLPDGADEDDGYQNFQAQLAAHPEKLNAILDDATARIRNQYDQILKDAGLPPTQRKPFQDQGSTTPGSYLAGLCSVMGAPVLERYSTDSMRMRLLAVQALINRYRWEHNALPVTLADLGREDLMRDDFTGEQLVYERNGLWYSLYSRGPLVQKEAGTTLTTERESVKLTP